MNNNCFPNVLCVSQTEPQNLLFFQEPEISLVLNYWPQESFNMIAEDGMEEDTFYYLFPHMDSHPDYLAFACGESRSQSSKESSRLQLH